MDDEDDLHGDDGGQASEADDIRIKPPREPEVKPEVYESAVNLLTRGFLTVSVDIGEIPFIFKSLNHHEFQLVRMLSGFEDRSRSTPPRFWDLFLAHMVLFVDGENVLADRNRHIGTLARTFKEMPKAARNLLSRRLGELNRQANRATELIEAYATESYSRWRWAQLRGLDLSSPAVTGIDGTERLGLSYAQLTWRAINYYEDLRQDHDAAWENAKFVGGCFAGKGIQKVYDRDSKRRQDERAERFNRKDQLLRHILLGDPIEQDKRYGGAQVVMVASTVEELAEQVEKSLKGEQDWHDKVIKEYEDSIRTKSQQRKEQLDEMVEARQEEMGGRNVAGGTTLSGLTPDQVAEILRDQQRRAVEAFQQQSERPAPPDERMAASLSKWGLDGQDGIPTTNRPTADAYPLQSRRTTGNKPWRP